MLFAMSVAALLDIYGYKPLLFKYYTETIQSQLAGAHSQYLLKPVRLSLGSLWQLSVCYGQDDWNPGGKRYSPGKL